MRVLSDLGFVVLRLAVGVIAIVHGVSKITNGPANVTEFFSSLGIPNPEVMAYLSIFVEVVGGAAIIIGLLTRLAALGLALTMGGAIYYAHLPHGFHNADYGYEFPMLIFAASVLLVLHGAGRISVDGLFASRMRARKETADTAIVVSPQPATPAAPSYGSAVSDTESTTVFPAASPTNPAERPSTDPGVTYR